MKRRGTTGDVASVSTLQFVKATPHFSGPNLVASEKPVANTSGQYPRNPVPRHIFPLLVSIGGDAKSLNGSLSQIKLSGT